MQAQSALDVSKPQSNKPNFQLFPRRASHQPLPTPAYQGALELQGAGQSRHQQQLQAGATGPLSIRGLAQVEQLEEAKQILIATQSKVPDSKSSQNNLSSGSRPLNHDATIQSMKSSSSNLHLTSTTGRPISNVEYKAMRRQQPLMGHTDFNLMKAGAWGSQTSMATSKRSLNMKDSDRSTKKSYQYCIDTRQIISMFDYANCMIKVSNEEIQEKGEAFMVQQANMQLRKQDIIRDLYQARSKSSSDSSNGGKGQLGGNSRKHSSLQRKESSGRVTEIKKKNTLELFCGRNVEMLCLMNYLNYKLREPEGASQSTQQTKSKQTNLFKSVKDAPSFPDKKKLADVHQVFGLDDNSDRGLQTAGEHALTARLHAQIAHNHPKFIYFVENEKILSKKMFYVDQQRLLFGKKLGQIKKQIESFIDRKYKGCITKIGFSSEKELFNIFKKMFHSAKGFFDRTVVRQILQAFWLSVKEVSLRAKAKAKMQGELEKEIGVQEEVLLKNNFYIRIELAARGRKIYEPQLDIEFENLAASERYAQFYPIHHAIFHSNLRYLSKLLKLEEEGTFFRNKNQLDPCGNTPLTLAVKLGNIDAVKILSDMFTCPKLRPLPDLMNAKEIAIAMRHQAILKILIQSNQKVKQRFFEDNKEAIFRFLEKLPDFKVDLNLTCESNWFPVFSSVAPSDTYKIYKQGSNLRLDMTLLGVQKFNVVKGNISVLFKGRDSGPESAGDLLIVDHKLSTVGNIFNRNNEAKVNQQIGEILSGRQVLKKYQTQTAQMEQGTDKGGKPVEKKVNKYQCQKWTLKSKYTLTKFQMNLSQIDRIQGFKSFSEYVEGLQVDFYSIIDPHQGEGGTEGAKSPGREQAERDLGRANGNGLVENQGGVVQEEVAMIGIQAHSAFSHQKSSITSQNKSILVKKQQQKEINANLWLSQTYPFDMEQFFPLIHILSFCSKQIRQFNKFLLKYPLPKRCFPVEARIPLFMTMEAVFSFKNLDLKFSDRSAFEVDKKVAEIQKQQMQLFAQKQISYLRLNSQLDTQEEKQAKALKEIYKLCKTEEGDNSGESQELRQAIREQRRPEEGIESENSDMIQERFNRMINFDEENPDLLLFEDNEGNLREEDQSVSRHSKPDQNAGNMVSASGSFHEPQQLANNEASRQQRLGGVFSPRGVKASLHTDATESIDVSERRVNDYAANHQIHCFKNVKFIGTLKESREDFDIPSYRKLEQILQEQFRLTGAKKGLPSSNSNVVILAQETPIKHQNLNFIKGSNQAGKNAIPGPPLRGNMVDDRLRLSQSPGKLPVGNNLLRYTQQSASIYKQSHQAGGGPSQAKIVAHPGSAAEQQQLQKFRNKKNDIQNFIQPNRHKSMSHLTISESSNFDNTSLCFMQSMSSIGYKNKPNKVQTNVISGRLMTGGQWNSKQGMVRNPMSNIQETNEQNLDTLVSCNQVQQRVTNHSLDRPRSEGSQAEHAQTEEEMKYLQDQMKFVQGQPVTIAEKTSKISNYQSTGRPAEMGVQLSNVPPNPLSNTATKAPSDDKLKLNFFQLVSNFFQESITDRRPKVDSQRALEQASQSNDQHSNDEEVLSRSLTNHNGGVSVNSLPQLAKNPKHQFLRSGQPFAKGGRYIKPPLEAGGQLPPNWHINQTPKVGFSMPQNTDGSPELETIQEGQVSGSIKQISSNHKDKRGRKQQLQSQIAEVQKQKYRQGARNQQQLSPAILRPNFEQ